MGQGSLAFGEISGLDCRPFGNLRDSMALLALRNLQLSFGPQPLLDQVELTIEPGERLCLVGRNGSGKSTLMKVIAGEVQPDDGEIEHGSELRIARLEQDVPGGEEGTVFDVVSRGLGREGTLLAEYHRLSLELEDGDEDTLGRFQRLQEEIDALGAWEQSRQVETVLSRMSLDGDALFARLSGGLKRRVLLARALVRQPDLLLLDEPTNHLDIEAIEWLENFLRDCGVTLLFITHDRALVRSLATRIIELDRGRLTSWPGNYDRYLEKKQEAVEAEEKARAEFDKKLSREEQWIRQGIKARRTRNQGRVRELQAMREEYARRRMRQGNARMNLQQTESSGRIVLEAEQLTHCVDDTTLFRDFSTTILRGERVGIIGPNGCGKSTLLRLLLGRETPQQGQVRHGTRLEIAWFDQLRESLDEDASVVDNVAEGTDELIINGKPRHVMSHLQDFLFEPARARQPVRSLSGGERARLLLARLFTRPFNLLVMDEPTNDLDTETLELLEEQLMTFDGTLLLVSHDREFLDNVVTRTLVFEAGKLNQYVGGYQDWLRQRPSPSSRTSKTVSANASEKEEKPRRDKREKDGLTYAQTLELKELPARIETLEAKQQALHEQMADPGFYQQDAARISATQQELAQVEAELDTAFQRWELLEAGERPE